MGMSDILALSKMTKVIQWNPIIQEKNISKHTHPLCFMCGGLSIRTANLIFKSESWLFFGTIIRCSSADLELLEVGYNITCNGHK